jgi:hypothetical protein
MPAPNDQSYSQPLAANGNYGNAGYGGQGSQPLTLTPGQSGGYASQPAYNPQPRYNAPAPQYSSAPLEDSRDPLLSRGRMNEDGSYLENPESAGGGYRPEQPAQDRYTPARPAQAAPQLSPSVVPMGPQRAPVQAVAAVSPPATLACPIVSALDRWILDAVQPAAQRWFNSSVVEIKQISAYSCRGMNGQPGAHISEHAFGNALDIAAFVLADGRKITVEKGWKGTAEEQGFLHDVQLAACDQFTTVLAPGSNVYHYNHIHVDLMRRASGRRICQPRAIPGEEVAARVRGRNGPMFAQRDERWQPASYERNARGQLIDRAHDPFAWRGPNRGGVDTTGSISAKDSSALRKVIDDEEFLGDDGDPEEHNTAPHVAAPRTTAPRLHLPRANASPAVDVNRIQ